MDSFKLKYIISFLTGIGTSAFFLLTPLYINELRANDFTLSIVVASFFFASMLSYVFFGRYSDARAVRKNLIVIGLLLMSIAYALHFFANSVWLLLMVRLFAGAASGIYAGPILAYLASGREYKVHLDRKST